jgi:hypothetical protein
LSPSANFNNVADWNDQDGNVTSVGTNGPPSFYKTFDQNGNVWEWTDQSDGSSNKICRGGAYDSELSDLQKCSKLSLSNTSRTSNTGFRLSRDIQNSEDFDDNILYYMGLESWTTNKETYETVIGGFKVNLDGSINEEKRIYHNKILTSSGETPIQGKGLTRSYIKTTKTGTLQGRIVAAERERYSTLSIIPINDNINILYNIQRLPTGLSQSGPRVPDQWKTFNGVVILDLSLGIEIIQYSTGKNVGSFTIEYPRPSDFLSSFTDFGADNLTLQSIDSDGFYITIIFIAFNDSRTKQFLCNFVVNPSSGTIVSKEFKKFETEEITNPAFFITKKINTTFLLPRFTLGFYSKNIPKNNGFFRNLVEDTFLVDLNYQLLTDKYIDIYAFFRDSGILIELNPGDNLNGAIIRQETWTWDDDSGGIHNIFSWAFDGYYLYSGVVNQLQDGLSNLPFPGRVPSFVGIIIAELSSMEIINSNIIVPTFLKDQSNYLTYLSSALLSEDYAKRSDIRSVIFSSWSRVGNANNSPDFCNSNAIGSVSEAFFMQKYPMTNNEYVAFLNSVAKESDPHNLWIQDMQDDPRGGIIRSGSSGNYTYTTKPNMTHKPVNFVNWFNAARFANWLHNQNFDAFSKETETGAYTLNGATTGNIPVNEGAIFRIPSADEWYKAAFYDHSISGYYPYATKSFSDPVPVCADENGNGKECL